MGRLQRIQKSFDAVNAVELGLGYDDALSMIAALTEGLEEMSRRRNTLVLQFSMTNEKVSSLVNPEVKMYRLRSFFHCCPYGTGNGAYQINLDEEEKVIANLFDEVYSEIGE